MMLVKAQSRQMESTHVRVTSGVVLNTSVFRMGPTIKRSATAKKPLHAENPGGNMTQTVRPRAVHTTWAAY